MLYAKINDYIQKSSGNKNLLKGIISTLLYNVILLLVVITFPKILSTTFFYATIIIIFNKIIKDMDILDRKGKLILNLCIILPMIKSYL